MNTDLSHFVGAAENGCILQLHHNDSGCEQQEGLMMSQARTVTHTHSHPFQAPPTPFKPLLPIPTLPTTPTSRHHQSNVLQGEGCHCPRLLHTHHPVTQTINGHDTSACRGSARSNGSTVRGGEGRRGGGGLLQQHSHSTPLTLPPQRDSESLRAASTRAHGLLPQSLGHKGLNESV